MPGLPKVYEYEHNRPEPTRGPWKVCPTPSGKGTRVMTAGGGPIAVLTTNPTHPKRAAADARLIAAAPAMYAELCSLALWFLDQDDLSPAELRRRHARISKVVKGIVRRGSA